MNNDLLNKVLDLLVEQFKAEMQIHDMEYTANYWIGKLRTKALLLEKELNKY